MQTLGAQLDLTAIEPADWKGFEVNVIQTPHVNRPTVKRQHPFFQFNWCWIARPTERKDAASWAKVIHRRPQTPLKPDEIFPWSQQSQILSRNPMNKRTAPTTNGAVAYSNMVNLGIDFELDLSAIAPPHGTFSWRLTINIQIGLCRD